MTAWDLIFILSAVGVLCWLADRANRHRYTCTACGATVIAPVEWAPRCPLCGQQTTEVE